MIKILLVIVLFISSIFAQNFNEFLNNALENSPYLKSNNLNINQAKEEGLALLRYENPTLGMKYSKFYQDFNSDGNGYTLEYSQVVQLPGLSDTKEMLSQSLSENAQASFLLEKSRLRRDISLEYTKYTQVKASQKLSQERLFLLQTLYSYTEKKYEEGAVSRGTMLELRLEYEMFQMEVEELKIEIFQRYFSLLKMAGIKEEVNLSTEHNFVLSKTKGTNLEIEYLLTKKNKAVDSVKVVSNAIESIQLYGEYEKEQSEEIMSFGVKIPLVIFNNKKEEKRIAKFEVQKQDYLIENHIRKVKFERAKLDKQREILENLKVKNEQLIRSLYEVLLMFEDAYAIAKTNLLEVQGIKEKIIMAKSNLVETQTKLDQNIIMSNYLEGSL